MKKNIKIMDSALKDCFSTLNTIKDYSFLDYVDRIDDFKYVVLSAPEEVPENFVSLCNNILLSYNIRKLSFAELVNLLYTLTKFLTNDL